MNDTTEIGRVAPVVGYGPTPRRGASDRKATPGVDWPAIVAVGVTLVLWASAFVAIRAVMPSLSPGAMAVGRLTVAFVVLSVIIGIRRPSLPRGNAMVQATAAGVLWFGLYNLALNAAERTVDAGTAALLVALAPILIAALAGFFLKEGFPPRLFIGCGLALAGTAVIATASGSTGGGGGLVGVSLCLAAAFLYAAGVTLQKPALRHADALAITWWGCGIGLLTCLPFVPTALAELPHAPSAAIAWIVFLGAFPTALAFTLWAFALRRMSAGRLGSTSYLVPPFAVLLGWLLLGEVPALLALGGGVVSIAGVAVARSHPRKPQPVVVA